MTSHAAALKPADFVHLHNHSQYSLLDGLQKISVMIERVKELGMEAVALTDHGTLSGVIEFYKEATSKGIKPLIGMETYVASRLHTDRDPALDKGRFHLILIAMNNKGYENLKRLSTIANLDGMYYKPRVDHQLLEKYNEGLIALSSCIGGEIGECLRKNQVKEATQLAEWYKGVFGDRFYIEIQDHGHPSAPKHWQEQKEVNDKLFSIADELGIPCVVTSDAHYTYAEDTEAHEILLCVQTGSFMADQGRMSLSDFHLHVTDPSEIIERWSSDRPDVITNTKQIADRCNVEIELGGILIPEFEVPDGETEKSYLEKLVFKGLAWRYGGIDKEKASGMTVKDASATLPESVLERALYELGVIEQMGFNGYFLIIWDFIKWGKDQGIVFGPGRGSAAGSIIAYALRITELDPLEYDLLFERFLNPDRISMPDIDIDIQDTRRDEVIDYVTSKYGSDRVANIVTFGKMMGRNAIRDVARVLQVPYADADRLAKLVPPPVQGRHIPLSKSVKESADLKKEYEANQTSKKVIDLAIKLEGTIRSHGVHAAGVVIAPDELVKYVPLEKAQKGVIATQYSMGPIEELGLLKMDFLGLANLSIINTALRIIAKVYGNKIDLSALSLDDKKTYELLSRGDTTGIFQMESGGMKQYLKLLKPDVFDDIIAMGALYRPGPLKAGLTDSFIKRKNGLEDISYYHETAKNALETTFGVIVYQEQVMQMSKDMCGFTGGQADTLRKAIGKKKIDVMEKLKPQFVDGGVGNGVPANVMEKIWQDLLGFADYAFNKSHSACYGLITYWTAYLKAHYPSAFMAAVMTSDQGNIDRLAIEIAECQHMGIDVLLPDINESFAEFAVVPSGDPAKDKIRFGLAAIKNVGLGAVEELVEERSKNGKYKSLEDFIKRSSSKVLNKKNLESLIQAGALDSLMSRGDLLFNLDSILQFASKFHKSGPANQSDLFGGLLDSEEYIGSITLENNPSPPTEAEMLQWERQLLGLYLSSHPLKDFKNILAETCHALSSIEPKHDDSKVRVGGIIVAIRDITTKNGSKMSFVRLDDGSAERELIIFPKVHELKPDLWALDKIIIANGKVNARDREGSLTNEVKVIVESAEELTRERALSYVSTGQAMTTIKASTKKQDEHFSPKTDKALYLQLKDSRDDSRLLKIKQALGNRPGRQNVILVLGDGSDRSVLRLPFTIDADPGLVEELSSILGPESVVIK